MKIKPVEPIYTNFSEKSLDKKQKREYNQAQDTGFELILTYAIKKGQKND